MRKYTEEEIPVDILRMMINKSRKYSIVILVNGHGQVGKTTFIRHIANRIMQIKKHKRLNPYDPDNTWNEWDDRKFTATNAYEFVKIWNENNDAVLTLAEASETLNYLDWYSIMGKVFDSTTTTQGLKRNICFLDTCFSMDLMKHAREKIDFRIWVYKRYDYFRKCITRNYWVEINYAKDKWRLRWLPNWEFQYEERELLLANRYTNWIAEFKEGVSKRNLELAMQSVGIYNPNKPITEKNMPKYFRQIL